MVDVVALRIPLSTADEIVTLREQLERAEFAARTNAEQYEAQKKAHREEVAALESQIGRQRKLIEAASAYLEKYRTLRSEMDAAIVKLPRFGWVTVTSVMENGLHRDACPRCKDVKCEGCVPGYDDSHRTQVADLTIERWQRTWSGRID